MKLQKKSKFKNFKSTNKYQILSNMFCIFCIWLFFSNLEKLFKILEQAVYCSLLFITATWQLHSPTPPQCPISAPESLSQFLPSGSLSDTAKSFHDFLFHLLALTFSAGFTVVILSLRLIDPHRITDFKGLSRGSGLRKLMFLGSLVFSSLLISNSVIFFSISSKRHHSNHHRSWWSDMITEVEILLLSKASCTQILPVSWDTNQTSRDWLRSTRWHQPPFSITIYSMLSKWQTLNSAWHGMGECKRAILVRQRLYLSQGMTLWLIVF